MFTWKQFYSEVVDRLTAYQFKNSELIELMAEMKRNGLKVSPFMDKDETGEKFPLEEIDPFTFLANFNRGITDDNRKAILSFLKDRWELSASIPEDFAGLPLVNLQKSWFMSYKPKRQNDHVPTLWKLFENCRTAKSIEDLDTALFDDCISLRNVGMAYLTMGMFWVRPDLWISLDKKNIALAQTLGVTVKPTSGAEYHEWLREVHRKLDVLIWEFSHQAHERVQAQEKVSQTVTERDDLAEPYRRLFDNVDHACEVLEIFKRVLTALKADENDAVTVVSFTNLGRYGGKMRVICGRWAVFGYRRRTKDTSFQILLPENHAQVAKRRIKRWAAPSAATI